MSHLNNFKRLRANFENSVKIAKRDFYANRFESCIGDSKQKYQSLNDLSGKSHVSKNVQFLKSSTSLNVTNDEIANSLQIFCRYC